MSQNYTEPNDGLRQWQIQAILEGIADADAGRVISHEEMVKKWEEKFGEDYFMR